MQSDSHLLPDTLLTALRGPSFIFCEKVFYEKYLLKLNNVSRHTACVSSWQHPQTFDFMHKVVFEHSDTHSIALLACIILHINGKQFRCSVFILVSI